MVNQSADGVEGREGDGTHQDEAVEVEDDLAPLQGPFGDAAPGLLQVLRVDTYQHKIE